LLLFAGLAIADTTGATSTTEPGSGDPIGVISGNNDVASASTSPATEEASGGWTHPRGNAGHSGVADAGPTGEPVELWRFQGGRNCHRQPAVVAGVVYAACHDGTLYALDAATGTERWRFTRTDLGAVVAVGELVYVEVLDAGGPAGVETNVLRALDAATGEERWHTAVPGGTGPAVDAGLLVVGTTEGFLLGFDATTGAERWRLQVSTQGVVDRVALAGGIAYTGVDAEGFFAVDAASGTLLWRGDIGGQRIGAAVVAEGVAYIGAAHGGGGRLYAFDATTGELLWRGDEPLFSPAVLDGVGYSGAEDGTVTAFDTADGTERWQTQLGGVVLNVAIADGVLYALSNKGPVDGAAVFALDAATGNQLWSFAVDSEVLGGVAVAGGIAVVDTDLAGIYAIGGTDQGAVAATTSP
jgi:eukaryotic-like serine/threonine-protein kinase